MGTDSRWGVVATSAERTAGGWHGSFRGSRNAQAARCPRSPGSRSVKDGQSRRHAWSSRKRNRNRAVAWSGTHPAAESLARTPSSSFSRPHKPGCLGRSPRLSCSLSRPASRSLAEIHRPPGMDCTSAMDAGTDWRWPRRSLEGERLDHRQDPHGRLGVNRALGLSRKGFRAECQTPATDVAAAPPREATPKGASPRHWCSGERAWVPCLPFLAATRWSR